MVPALTIQEIVGGTGDRKARVPVPYKTRNSASPRRDVRERSGGGERGWKDVGANANCELRRKRFHRNTKGSKL
jgi:hypothetical protein